MTIHKTIEPLLKKAADSKGLSAFLKEFEADLSAFAKAQEGFLAQLTDYVFSGSGKRVRPGLVYVCSQFGASSAQAVKEAALAVEMIHIATLIHDDLVDEASLRRRKPTVSVKFGDGAAVLLGDFVYAQAFQRLSTLNDPEVMRLFADTTMIMCDGEIAQLERRYCFDLSEEEYLTFLDKKTASLMAASCRTGGKLCGLAEKQILALEQFGRQLGIAFQIVDDILDLEGEEALTGKTLRTDLTHGKITLPLIHYRKQLKTAAEREEFMKTLKNPDGQLTGLIQRVHAAGSIAYSRQRALELLQQAEDALSLLPDHPSRRLLSGISQGLSQRQH